MICNNRPPSPCFNDADLSKNFGLDITVSDGGLVSSASNQRQYQAECSRIYQQFVLNMSDYINEETQLRKTLNVLQSQQKKTQNKSIGRITPHPSKTPDLADEDAFTPAQLEEFQSIINRESSRSRLSQANGYLAADHLEVPSRGPTPIRSISSLANQPAVTHMFPALKERPPSVKATQLKKEARNLTSTEEDRPRTAPANAGVYEGIMETNTELSSNRRVRVNPRAFNKLLTGQVRVKLLNKNGDFVLTPMTSSNPSEDAEKQVMDNKERVAIVKRRTTFQSPTLSSDLKISNLVAIQKALKGQAAKRVTVGEVMRGARDRRARIFRVQMTGNKFDEFDQQQEDLGYVHEVKAATDLDEADLLPVPRPASRGRTPNMNVLRHQEQQQRPDSRLRTPTPIPLHILDPKTAWGSRANTPAFQKQVSMDFSGLQAHPDNSIFEHRYTQVAEKKKPKDKNKPKMSVVQIGYNEHDSKPDIEKRPETHVGHVATHMFPVSQNNRVLRAKSAGTALTQRSKRSVYSSMKTDVKTTKVDSGFTPPPSPPVKRINSMRDTAAVVRLWRDDDREREDKLNRWRMRMSFAATRRGNLTKVLTRSSSGK